jgi:nucleoside-diphosphate-sugar epimerase
LRVLVTGAAGLIGSHLVRRLDSKHEIYAVDRRVPAEKSVKPVHWVLHDLAQPLADSHFPRDIDAVIHLAQSRYYRHFPDKAEDIFDVNIHSTLRLLEYARGAGAQSFILASTGGLYAGRTGESSETDRLEARNFYFASKYAAELLTSQYQGCFRTIILRFFFVYGPGQHGMLISNLMHQVRAGEVVTIEGDPGLHINPIFVDDAVEAFEPALTLKDSSVINIAGDEVVSITALVNLIGEALGREPRAAHHGASPGGHLVGNTARMKSMLGVHPAIRLPQGLKRLADACLPPPKIQIGTQ